MERGLRRQERERNGRC